MVSYQTQIAIDDAITELSALGRQQVVNTMQRDGAGKASFNVESERSQYALDQTTVTLRITVTVKHVAGTES